MKWAAIGLGTSILALGVGAYALLARDGGQGTRDVGTRTVAPTAESLPSKGRAVSSVTKPVLDSQAGDSNDDQAGDSQAGDDKDDQAGDSRAGDGNDDQAGDGKAGDGNDDQAGDGRAGGA